MNTVFSTFPYQYKSMLNKDFFCIKNLFFFIIWNRNCLSKHRLLIDLGLSFNLSVTSANPPPLQTLLFRPLLYELCPLQPYPLRPSPIVHEMKNYLLTTVLICVVFSLVNGVAMLQPKHESLWWLKKHSTSNKCNPRFYITMPLLEVHLSWGVQIMGIALMTRRGSHSTKTSKMILNLIGIHWLPSSVGTPQGNNGESVCLILLEQKGKE